MEPSVWTRSVPFVRDGQAVNAQVTNAPTQVLADRTAALKAILDAIQAGEQLVLRNAPLGEDVEEGHVVYLNPTTLRYERALARYKDLVGSDGRLLPADTAVIAGIVYNKASAAVGDLLCSGMVTLSDAAVLRLFNGETPSTAFYYLSSLTAGTVETSTPALLVRTCQWVAGNIVRVFAPTFEPGTHLHRDYRLYAGDWRPVGFFDPTLVPTGAKYGYNLESVHAVEQTLREVLLPATGEPEFVWVYTGTESGVEITIGPLLFLANRLTEEAPNGVRTDFTLQSGHVFSANSLFVSLNGQLYSPENIVPNGGRTGFSISGGIIPTALDMLTCTYVLEGGGGGGSSTEEITIPLSGRHVNSTTILLNESGIWWFSTTPPPQDIFMTLTSANVRELALIHSLWSKTPASLEVTNNSGRVALGLKEFTTADDWTADQVVGHVDMVNGQIRRRKVVTNLQAGLHLRVDPAEGEGDLVVSLAMFSDFNLPAAIVNLNNAVTRTESPYVFTEFPVNRVSGANFAVNVPNIDPDSDYKMVLWGVFLGTGLSIDAPMVACSALPTPNIEGSVVYALPDFPVLLGTIPAGLAAYLVECPVEIDGRGLANGQLLFEFTVTNPASSLKLLSAGARLSLKDA
jgi:hypothetical protein